MILKNLIQKLKFQPNKLRRLEPQLLILMLGVGLLVLKTLHQSRLMVRRPMFLLDSGAQISTISKKWVQEANLPIYELENLVEIIQAGGSILDYDGFTEVTITSDQIPSLDLTFPVLVVSHTDYHEEIPLTLGTKTLYHIYDSGILKADDKLPTNWKFTKDDVEFKKKLEGQPDKPIGFAKMSKTEKIAPNENRILHCLAKAKAMVCQLMCLWSPWRFLSYLLALNASILILTLSRVVPRLQLPLEM